MKFKWKKWPFTHISKDCNEHVICKKVFLRRVWRYQREVIRIRKSKKDRQHNRQKKKYKMTNNDLQSTTQKTKDQATRTPLTTAGKRRCSGRERTSCSTSCDTLVTNPMISHVCIRFFSIDKGYWFQFDSTRISWRKKE